MEGTQFPTARWRVESVVEDWRRWASPKSGEGRMKADAMSELLSELTVYPRVMNPPICNIFMKPSLVSLLESTVWGFHPVELVKCQPKRCIDVVDCLNQSFNKHAKCSHPRGSWRDPAALFGHPAMKVWSEMCQAHRLSLDPIDGGGAIRKWTSTG